MSTVAVQYDLATLLEMAGANPRGRRHDCPKCGGWRTITHSDEVFFCHRCQWKGNAITLAKELGVHARLSRAEYHELRDQHERVRDAAERLGAAVKGRRLELLEELCTLNRLEAGAHKAGPTAAAWNALCIVYTTRLGLLAELTILDNGGAADLVRFLSAKPELRQATVSRVAERGSLIAAGGRIIDVGC